MGNAKREAKGSFILIDSKTFVIKGNHENSEILFPLIYSFILNTGHWNQETTTQFGYDFWYQPRHNVMISSEWGAPSAFEGGFSVNDVAAGRNTLYLRFIAPNYFVAETNTQCYIYML